MKQEYIDDNTGEILTGPLYGSEILPIDRFFIAHPGKTSQAQWDSYAQPYTINWRREDGRIYIFV